jgi:hypothetical protein
MVKFRGVTYEDGAAKTERNDCTVCATAEAFAIPYHEAHALLTAAGRKPRHKFSFYFFVRCFLKTLSNGCVNHRTVTAVRMPWHLPTLAQFVKDFPQGTFIVRKRGHVFCVRNGIVYDSTPQGARVRIRNVWYIA